MHRLAILLLATACARADLVFEELMKERHLAPDARAVEMDFNFRNGGDKPVKIRHYDAACSCLTAQVKGGKLEYAPGEEGVIRAEFDMGNFSGQVDKQVVIWIDDDPEDEPSVVLTVRVHIPELVVIEPKTLRWAVGEEVEPKRMRITMVYEKPIKIVSVGGSNDRFSHQLKEIRAGEEYELTITPDETKTPGIGVLRIQTDCPVARHRIRQAFLVVQPKRDVPAVQQPGTSAGQSTEHSRRLAKVLVPAAVLAALGLWKLLGRKASAT